MIDQWGHDTPLTEEEIDALLEVARSQGRAWFSPVTTALLEERGLTRVHGGASVLTDAGRARLMKGR